MLNQPVLFKAISGFSPFFVSRVGRESSKNKTHVPPDLQEQGLQSIVLGYGGGQSNLAQTESLHSGHRHTTKRGRTDALSRKERH